MFHTRVVDKIETHILCSATFLKQKIVPFMSVVEKYCTAGQATNANMVYAHCMLNT
jgi:hypothetical protein